MNQGKYWCSPRKNYWPKCQPQTTETSIVAKIVAKNRRLLSAIKLSNITGIAVQKNESDL